MLRIARFFLLAAVVAAPLGCAAGGTSPTADRLNKLEAQMKTTQTYDMRIAHLEDRLTLLEQDIGRVKAGGPAPRVVDPNAKSAAPRPVAKPVSEAPADAEPVSAAPMLPVVLPEKASAPDTQPAAAAAAQPRASASPVQAALADLGGGTPAHASSASTDYYSGARRVAPPQHAGAAPGPAPTAAVSVGQTPPPAPPATVPASPSIPALASTATPAPALNGSGAPAPAPETGAPQKAGSAGQSAYNTALALFENGQYTEAKAAFEDFLAANPKHSLRPNAQYWIGECLYSKGDYSGAILSFTTVAGDYPTHPKAAAALLKAGYSYANLGDQDNARFYWQMLRNDFPKSSEARLAAKRMGPGQ